jgi:hypothetical protein
MSPSSQPGYSHIHPHLLIAYSYAKIRASLRRYLSHTSRMAAIRSALIEELQAKIRAKATAPPPPPVPPSLDELERLFRHCDMCLRTRVDVLVPFRFECNSTACKRFWHDHVMCAECLSLCFNLPPEQIICAWCAGPINWSPRGVKPSLKLSPITTPGSAQCAAASSTTTVGPTVSSPPAKTGWALFS